MKFKVSPEDVPQPQTPAETMLPTPQIVEDALGVHISSMARYIGALNADNRDQQRLAEIDPTNLTPGVMGYQRFKRFAVERYTDDMTGLLNRAGLDLWLERYKPAKFAVLFLDVRNFGAEINNRYGHSMGDRVISFLGEKMASRIRVHEPDEDIEEKRAHPEVRDVIGVGRHKEGAKNGFGRWGGDEVVACVDLSTVPDDKVDKRLAELAQRGESFGVYHDQATGVAIPLSVRSVATLGTRDDGKRLQDYFNELDQQMRAVKVQEIASA